MAIASLTPLTWACLYRESNCYISAIEKRVFRVIDVLCDLSIMTTEEGIDMRMEKPEKARGTLFGFSHDICYSDPCSSIGPMMATKEESNNVGHMK